MNDVILIKGNKFGFNIILNDEVAFSEIEEALKRKLTESRKFFGNSKVTIEFEGRKISSEELNLLIEVIRNSSDLDIICIIDPTLKFAVPAKSLRQPLPALAEEIRFRSPNVSSSDGVNPDGLAIFHKGNLRSGQEITSDSSIIVVGNVHNGATLTSKGNVIIIGKLSGSVYAGKDGNNAAFVVALNMSPTQLRIADVFGRAPDIKKGKKIIPVPQIAFVEEDRIMIEDINRNIHEQINGFFK